MKPLLPSSYRSSQSFSMNTASTTDRKSTRLNSSHLGISYAVFCLKKGLAEPNDHPALEKQRTHQRTHAQRRDPRPGRSGVRQGGLAEPSDLPDMENLLFYQRPDDPPPHPLSLPGLPLV